MWEDFREVPPGRALAFPEGSTQNWEPRECIEAPEAQDLAIRSAELRALLFDVVVRNLPASGPIGVYLSGGLDSSLVTAILAKLAPGRVHSYAVHFGAGYPNELQFSDAVARHCATNHHVIEIPIASIRDALLTTHAALSNPIGDPLTCPNFILGRTAARDTNVIFNGEGGDPCFGGPKNMPMLLHQLHAGAHGGESVESAYLRSYQKCYDDLDRLLRPEVRAALEAAPPQEELLRPFFEGDAMSSFLNRLMHINVRVKGADNILTKVNDLTTANGLLGISPLFDRRVVDFSFSAPPRFKLDGATEKAVLKRAVVDLLPESVVYRPKSGMMVPVQRWFKRELREIAQDWLLGKDGRVAEFLDTAVVRRWLEFRGELFPRQGAKLWLALGLEAWLRAHERR